MKWAGHVARMEEGISAFKILTANLQERGFWGMDLKEIGINMRNWVDSAQERNFWRALVNASLSLWAPQAMELVII